MAATTESKKMIMPRSSDGVEFEIEENVAKESQTIKHMIEDDCVESVISLPNVNSKILSKVIEYSKTWDAEFVKVDQATIFDLIMHWQFQSDPFFSTKREASQNTKKEESEYSKTEKTKGMMKKANTEDTKKEEAKDMEKEETDNVQDVEMEDREAEDSKLLEDTDVIKEQDNKDVEGKVEEIKDAVGEAEGAKKKRIRGQKGTEKQKRRKRVRIRPRKVAELLSRIYQMWRTRSERRSQLNLSCFIKHILEELGRSSIIKITFPILWICMA